jgi:hypothetical protein
MRRRIPLAAAAFLTPLIALGAEKLLPRLDSTDGQTRLIVDGSPYLILGAQVHNSANADDLAKALDTARERC